MSPTKNLFFTLAHSPQVPKKRSSVMTHKNKLLSYLLVSVELMLLFRVAPE